MLKKKITYVDFDGNQAEDIFYFNLNKIELMEMELSGEGGSFVAWLQRISETEEREVLLKEFKKLILTAYGVRSEDGKHFEKSPELREKFSQHAAFEALFMDIATREDAAIEFVTGIIPHDMKDKIGTEMVKATPSPPKPPTPKVD